MCLLRCGRQSRPGCAAGQLSQEGSFLLPHTPHLRPPTTAIMQEWKWEALRREVPGVEAVWCSDLTHAFCVSEHQSAALAQRLAPMIQAALEEHARVAAAAAAAAVARP